VAHPSGLPASEARTVQLFKRLSAKRFVNVVNKFGIAGLTIYGHIKTAEQRTAVTGTLAVDGWAVTFGTARRGLDGLRPRPVPSSLYQM